MSDDNLSKVIFTLLGALIGFISSVGLEGRKRRVERREMGRVLAARIESHLEVGRMIEQGLSSPQQSIEEIRELFAVLEQDREYNAFLSKIGLFGAIVIEKIMGYYDYVVVYRNNLAKLQKPDDLGRLEGYFMQRILALECLLYLAHGPIGDRALFRSAKERLRNEYQTRFLPVMEALRQQGKDPAEAEKYTRSIERVFRDFKMDRELKISMKKS
jgi:hypothetical protein